VAEKASRGLKIPVSAVRFCPWPPFGFIARNDLWFWLSLRRTADKVGTLRGAVRFYPWPPPAFLFGSTQLTGNGHSLNTIDNTIPPALGYDPALVVSRSHQLAE